MALKLPCASASLKIEIPEYVIRPFFDLPFGHSSALAAPVHRREGPQQMVTQFRDVKRHFTGVVPVLLDHRNIRDAAQRHCPERIVMKRAEKQPVGPSVEKVLIKSARFRNKLDLSRVIVVSRD